MAASRRSLQLVVAGTAFALLTSAAPARADVHVALQYESASELEHARRVASELASEGYTVELSALPEVSPCDRNGPRLTTLSSGTKAWIRLAADPTDPERVVAFICYLGAQPLLEQATPSAARDEGEQLALAAAEALNGLRARLPPLQNEPQRLPRHEHEPVLEHSQSPPVVAARTLSLENSVSLGAGLVRTFPDFSTMTGVTARASLGIVPSFALMIDVFAPAVGGELASAAMTAQVRTSWVRVGPRLGWVLGDFELSAAVLAGPAITWATAVATPPRQGAADVASGAIVSLGAFAQYPATTPVFGCASLSGSVLLPAPRVNLAADTPPRGDWPIDASVGIGARWGN